LSFGFVSAQLQAVAGAFAKASPKLKNPRSERLHYFLKRPSVLAMTLQVFWHPCIPAFGIDQWRAVMFLGFKFGAQTLSPWRSRWDCRR
jgi:hypothetical protein